MSNKCTHLAKECVKCILHKEGSCKGIYFNDNIDLNKIAIIACQKQLRILARRKTK